MAGLDLRDSLDRLLLAVASGAVPSDKAQAIRDVNAVGTAAWIQLPAPASHILQQGLCLAPAHLNQPSQHHHSFPRSSTLHLLVQSVVDFTFQASMLPRIKNAVTTGAGVCFLH